MYRTHLSDSQRSTRNMAATGRQCQACTRRGRSAGKSAHVVLGPSHVMEVIVEVREVIMEVRLSMLASVLNIETLCFNADINVHISTRPFSKFLTHLLATCLNLSVKIFQHLYTSEEKHIW